MLVARRRVVVRLLLLIVVFVLAVVAGAWWRARPPAARHAIDLNSTQDLQNVLADANPPGAGAANVVDPERDDVPALPPDECLGAGKNADDVEAITPVEEAYGGAVVRLSRVRSDRRDDVARMIRSAQPFCVRVAQPYGYPMRTAWTRVANTGFGEESAVFRTARTVDDAKGPVLDPGDTVVYVISGRWIVRVQVARGGDPATDQFVPALLRHLDSVLHTQLAASLRNGSGCGSVPGSPALTPAEHDAVTLIHDSACRRAVDDLRPLMLGRFVDNGGPTTSEVAARRFTPQVLDVVVSALEQPPVRKHGALTFRAGDAAVLFDLVGNWHLNWTGLVTHCGTPERPGGPCSSDRNGPLGDTAWESSLQELGCEQGVEVDAVHYTDVTGDGRPEAIVAASCIPETGSRPQELRVYQGISGRPELVARLLGTQDGTDARGLRIEYAGFSPPALTVVSAGYRNEDANAFPTLIVTDRFDWNGTSFTRIARSVQPRQS